MTQIFNDNGFLNFSIGTLANVDDYETSDRCEGSIFESLEPGETVVLSEGEFKIDEDLDLIKA
jgi:hypothetical protein